MKCQVDAIQWGGVVAEFFPWSPKVDVIQWGGGSGSSRIFPVVSKSLRDSVGGGG